MRRAEIPPWSSFAFSAALGFACLSAVAVTDASAQQYPTKPIRIIALSSPASGPDIVGRLIGSKFTESWGQQVIVDTRPGASGRPRAVNRVPACGMRTSASRDACR